MNANKICWLLAVICFGIGAFYPCIGRAQPNWLLAGLFFATLAYQFVK